MNYYDIVLLSVPVSIMGGILASIVTAVPFQLAIIIGAVFGIAIIGHSMFINPPVDVLTPPEKPQSDSFTCATETEN